MRVLCRLTMLSVISVSLLVGASGCSAGTDDDVAPAVSQQEADEQPEATVVEPTVDAEGIPLADPSLDIEDAFGRTPADAFTEHMAAVATGDPEAVWDTYGCSPPADFDTWAVEWEDAAEVYSGARVLEERVIAPGSALVRVVYRVRSGDDEVIVEEPGEWWRIEQGENGWKVGWLPRQ